MHATKSIVRILLKIFHVFHYCRQSLTTKRFKCMTISQNTHFHRKHQFNRYRIVSEWQIKNNLNENFLTEKKISSILFLLASCISVATMDWSVIGNSLISLLYRAHFHFAFPHRITLRAAKCWVLCGLFWLFLSEIAQLPCAQLSHIFGAGEW